MSKLKVGDHVRVILAGSKHFDAVGVVVTVFASDHDLPEAYRVRVAPMRHRIYGPSDLTLADPWSTTVLDQMDAESITVPVRADGSFGPVDLPSINPKSDDPVNHPAHYGGDTTYEVIKVAEAWGLDKDAYLFNVLKYVARAGKKGDVLEDLEKGDFYLNRRIATMKAAQ